MASVPLFFRASALAPLTELTSLPWGRKKETLFQQNGWYGHYMIKIPKDLSREICFIDRYIKTVGVGVEEALHDQEVDTVPRYSTF